MLNELKLVAHLLAIPVSLPPGRNGLDAQPLVVMALEAGPEHVLVLTNVLVLQPNLRLVLTKLRVTVSFIFTHL